MPEPEPPISVPPVYDGGFIVFGDINLNHEIKTVKLDHSFVNPVVIMGTLSYNGRHPSTVRVMNVQSTSFDVQIQEWAYLDGPHTTERISWLVAEAGHHVLDDGSVYEAGTKKVGGTWNCVNFEEEI